MGKSLPNDRLVAEILPRERLPFRVEAIALGVQAHLLQLPHPPVNFPVTFPGIALRPINPQRLDSNGLSIILTLPYVRRIAEGVGT